MAESISSQNNTEVWKPSKNPWLVALPTVFAAFMFVLDETIANVALPHMAGTFSVSREESTWILTSYLVASGIAITAVDWFSKLMGRKNFFIFSVILFTLSSVLCGISNSIGMMIFARILQGFGGGGLLPVAQAVLLESFEPRERGQAMAVFGLVIIVAPIIGPVVGGWITDNYSWPWIFFINLPFGILTVWLAKTLLEDPPYARKQKNVKLDTAGFFLLTLWLTTLQIILDKGNNADWFNAPWICRLTVICVLSGFLFFVSQMKKDSLVDLRVFKDRNFSAGTVIQVVITGILLASVAILPQFLQSIMGYTAFLSGLTIMPRGIGALTASILFGLLAKKVDNRLLAIIGLALIGTAGLKFGFLNLQIASVNIAIPNFIFGLGMGFAMMPIVSLSVATLANSQMTNASGIQSLLKNIGGAIGTSVVSTMISRFSQAHQFMMVGNLNPLNSVYAAKISAAKAALSAYMAPDLADYAANYSLYGELLKQSVLWGFMEAFRICGIAAIVVIPIVFLIKNFPKEENTSSVDK
ncbi:MAG: DHA2 family efflux MFS transporter permease subunit [Candidatus Gastranaerophilales bacterium]|nr:DHA2 family efflux MFS transporter permease subunit [Candidatus Gastranaerophilales bacterium]